jgi:hypothetical protein
MERNGLVQGNGGEQRQRRRGRVLRLQPDEGAGIEVARWRDPDPSLPPSAADLPLGAQPEAFFGPVAREIGDVVVG